MTALRTAAEQLHRNAPADDAAALRENLDERHRGLVRRHAELLARSLPEKVSGDDEEQRLTDYGKQLRACERAIDAARMAAKKPYDDMAAVAHAWGRRMQDALTERLRAVTKLLTDYKNAKAEAARRAAAEEAERLRRAAEEAAAVAQTEDQLRQAIDYEEAARQAERLAVARPPELSRSRGDLGAMSSLRQTWTFRVVDLARVPHPYLTLNEAAVRQAIRAGVREIPGLEIFPETKAVIR